MKAKIISLADEVALILPREIVMMMDLVPGQALHVRRLRDGGFRIGPRDAVYDRGLRIAKAAMVKYAERSRP
jgi:hypothetical protein